MTTTVTSVNSTTSSTAAIAADGTRTSLVFENTDDNRAYLLAGSGTATTSAGGYTFSLVENGSATLTPPDSHLAWQVIWAGDGSGALSITAITDPVVDDNGTISTYAELKTALAAWLKPGTSLPSEETTSRIPEYIALAESDANSLFRTRTMDTVDTALTVTTGSATIPTGFRQMRSLVNTESPYNTIDYLPEDQFEALDITETGKPLKYTIAGSTLLFWPDDSTTVRARYRRGLTPLSSDNDTNWLLAKYPGFYLYGSLAHADTRLVDPERLGLIQPRLAQIIQQILDDQRGMIGHILRPLPSSTAVI